MSGGTPMTTQSVHCAKCNALIDEPPKTKPQDRKPCPACGSTARLFKKKLEATLSFHDSVRMKLTNAATGKTTLEQFSGDDLHRKSGKWMMKQRVIDREKDKYKEVVTDPETGKVVRHCEEPLTKHTGRGSAKHETAGTTGKKK
jgi:phage FluMu protein Com